MAVEAESSILVITVVTIGLIFALLLLIYRRLSVALVILGTVGLSLAVARGLTAWMGLHGVFDVSTFTGSFLTAIVLGAGTDYAIFLVSRYHEQRRLGVAPRTAASYAAGRVSAVIIGSALTVVLANACMLVAELGVYTTTGPARPAPARAAGPAWRRWPCTGGSRWRWRPWCRWSRWPP